MNTVTSSVINAHKANFADSALVIEGVISAAENIHSIGEDDDEINPGDLMRLKPQVGEDRMIVMEDWIVVGGLDNDHDCESPLTSCDGEGMIHLRGRNGSKDDTQAIYSALGLDCNGGIPADNPAINQIMAGLIFDKIIQDHDALSALRYGLSKSGKPLLQNAIFDELKRLIVADGIEKTQNFLMSSFPNVMNWEYLMGWSYVDAYNLARSEGLIGEPMAVLLDVYQHGGISYSVSWEGMQCQFDTSRHAAMWIPCQYAKENILMAINDESGKTGVKLENSLFMKALKTESAKYCKSVLETYNNWVNGENYGMVVYVINRKTGRRVKSEDEECWGFIGHKHAVEELEMTMISKVRSLSEKMATTLSVSTV